MFLILFTFYRSDVNIPAHKWEHKLKYIDHQTTYKLMLYKPSMKPWEAIVVTQTGQANNADTTYLNIQTDQGMLLGEFSFYKEDSTTFLNYVFIHHNATVVTQVFNVSTKIPDPFESYWRNKEYE